MEFADVVELEPQAGDAEYTEWLKAGRPKLDGATRNAMDKHPGRKIDTLDGL